MSITIDANKMEIARRMGITTSRMKNDYSDKTVDEIIKAEASQGNTQAIQFAKKFANSPEKLINLLRLSDGNNKFQIINELDYFTKQKLLPFLTNEDLTMGLYFFNQEKILTMLLSVSPYEIANVALGTFALQDIVLMLKDEDLSKFFQRDELPRYLVMEQLSAMPPKVLKKFVEEITGMAYTDDNRDKLFQSISNMQDEKYKDFMSGIDPDVQRQLVYQIADKEPQYMQLFSNYAYCEMMSTIQKQDLIPNLELLNPESLVKMNSELPGEMMAVVASQIEPKDLVYYLLENHIEFLQSTIFS